MAAIRYHQTLRQIEAEPKRWLVTGAAGFIGSHIAQALIENGQEVIGLDNLSTGNQGNIGLLEKLARRSSGEFRFLHGDVRDKDCCDTAMRKVDYLCHQAALGSVPRSLAYPWETHANNVEGTVNVLLAARRHGVQGISCASSSSVYGDHPALPKIETEIGQPLSPYALSKRVCEEYARTYHRSFDLPVIALRYFNVFGPRQSPDGPYAAVIPRWISALRQGERPTLFGDGQTSRDFCPVASVVQANILACRASVDYHGQVYNIALGGETTLLELFSALRGSLVEQGLPCAGIEARFEGFRPGDIRHSRADIRAAREHLGYEPEVDFAAGVRLLVEDLFGEATSRRAA